MSYIQLQLGGQLRGLKFNNAAVDTYWSKVSFTELAASSVYATIYAGLIGNDIAKGVRESEFNYEAVTEWVDELLDTDETAVATACGMFSETIGYKKKLEKIQEHIRLLQGEADEKKNMKAA